MNQIKTNKIGLLLLILLPAINLISCKNREDPSARPNIIFIMTDDHAAHATGVYKSRLSVLNPTPNIDQLAREGMLFTNCFATNSICTPSRATILTGQYSQRNGVLDLWSEFDASRQFLPQEMKKLGYETAMIGKWHLGVEPSAFDYYKVLPVQGKYFDPEFREMGRGTWPDNIVKHQGHSSTVVTDQVINWLKQRKSNTDPFFLMYHFKAPHDMFQFDPKYANYLKDTKIPEPANMYSQPNWGSEATRGSNDSLLSIIGSSISTRHTNRSYADIFRIDTTLSGDQATSAAYQEYLKRYLRCVKGVDENLGRFFQFLKQHGLWENTIIVYTSDQGMMLGEHDFEDKRWMYEESMRMPLITRYPELIGPEMQSDLLVNNTDFAPTLLELAGGTSPAYMQGRSMLEILKGEEPENWRNATYYRYWMHMVHHDIPAHFGIRTKKYKLIFFYGRYHDLEKEGSLSMYWNDEEHSNKVLPTPVAWELYDLENDPEEVNNIYQDPTMSAVVSTLKTELARQRKELGEEDENYPHLDRIIREHWND